MEDWIALFLCCGVPASGPLLLVAAFWTRDKVRRLAGLERELNRLEVELASLQQSHAELGERLSASRGTAPSPASRPLDGVSRGLDAEPDRSADGSAALISTEKVLRSRPDLSADESTEPRPSSSDAAPVRLDDETPFDTEEPANAEELVDAEGAVDAEEGASSEAEPSGPDGGATAEAGSDSEESTGEETAPPRAAALPSRVGWEQWLGVRGAAALGGVLLVIAALYFFEYGVEHGWFGPALRVAAGTLAGLGCIGGAEVLFRRRHPSLAGWLAGAGIAVLYLAFWAGAMVYQLYPVAMGAALLVAVTAACVALSATHGNPVIAALGILGGFATPLALSTGQDRPFSLFGYLLLLDLGLLWLAHRRRWPLLAGASLVATALYELGWLWTHLRHWPVWLGVGIVSLFALLFVLVPQREDRDDDRGRTLWRLVRMAGLLLPLLMTFSVAASQGLDGTFWPSAAQLTLLCILAVWVGVRERSPLLPLITAVAAAGTVAGWGVANGHVDALGTWQLVGLSLVLVGIFVLGATVARRRGQASDPRPVLALVGLTLVWWAYAAVQLPAAGPWPWCVGAVFSFLAVSSVVREAATSAALPFTALGGGVTLGLAYLTRLGHPAHPSGAVYLAALVGMAVLGRVAALTARRPEVSIPTVRASLLLPVVLLAFVPLAEQTTSIPTWAVYGATAALVGSSLSAAAQLSSATAFGFTLLTSAAVYGVWIARQGYGHVGALDLVMGFAMVLVHSAYPALLTRRGREQAWVWRVAAAAGPLHFLPLYRVYLELVGSSTIGVLPIALAAIALGVAKVSRIRGPEEPMASRSAVLWLLVAASAFITATIPIQLEREWITIGWALEAFALILLWRRFDHAGLKYLTMTLAGVVCIRLLFNPYLLAYHVRGGMPVFNWLSYTYLVPAAALGGVWAVLRRHEVGRRRPWEQRLFPWSVPLMASVSAAGALILVFAWLNLTIIDWFAVGPSLHIPSERLPSRDLALSLGWGSYALALLALGTWRRSMALRATSLGLILLTLLKTFLYDLGHLRDLYRVAALVGLAFALIATSLAYRYLVFRESDPSELDGEEAS